VWRFLKKISAGQFLRFCLIGSLNTLLDFLIVNSLAYLFQIYHGFSLIIINSFSFITVVTISFFLNKNWTFKKVQKEEQLHSVKRQYLLFFLINLIGLAINNSIVYLITTVIGRQYGLSPVVWLNFSKAIAVSIVLFWNFFNLKYVVFRRRQ